MIRNPSLIRQRMRRKYLRQKQHHRGGTVLALLAVFLPVAVILAGFAINVAYMELSRSELRVATDAAARAGGRTLAMTGDETLARNAALDFASRNTVAGSSLQVSGSDVVFGQALRPSMVSRYTFTAGTVPYNALQIDGRRTSDSPGGAVNLFLPHVMSVGTFEPVQSATVTQIELDVAIVLDRSGSMSFASDEIQDHPIPYAAPAGWDFCDEVPTGSRWLDAITAVNEFLAALSQTPQGEKVALVTYSDSPTIDVNLTTAYTYDDIDGTVSGVITDAMNGHSLSFCGGDTNIGDAIQLGRQALLNATYGRPWASKAIVVLTDGKHNAGTDPDGPAQAASDLGITTYTITFSDEAYQAEMQAVAEIGGGIHVHASTGAELEEAFRRIARSLPTLLTD